MLSRNKIAFIGLGAMGINSARCLVKAGFHVQGYDLQPSSLQAFSEAGGYACNSMQEVISGVDYIVFFVVSGAQVEQILFGGNGISGLVKSNQLICSLVTMSPVEAVDIGRRCAASNLTFIDAPVSGGQVGAKNGSLVIMASGDAHAIQAMQPIFSVIGKHIVVAGNSPGDGAMLKAINQLLCGVHLAAAGEALALAERAGLNKEVVFEVISQSAAASWMLNDRGPRMILNAFEKPTSAVDIFVKDLGIVLDVARSFRFPVPLSSSALQSFLGSSGAGNAKLDDAAVINFYKGFNVLENP